MAETGHARSINRNKWDIPLVELNLIATEKWTDLLSGKTYSSHDDSHIELEPYDCAWISNLS